MRAIENVFSGTGGQIDLLNTLYGGSSLTTMNVEREEERLALEREDQRRVEERKRLQAQREGVK